MEKNDEKNIVICDNCNAEFDAKEPKCPFCGYINPYGAQKKYMQDMQEIKTNLSKVDDEQIDLIKKETKKVWKIVAITIGAILAVVALVSLVLFIYNRRMIKHYEELGVYESDPVKAAQWNDLHIDDINALYEAKEIDALVDYYGQLSANGDVGAFNNWEHSFMITQIYDLRFWMSYLDDGSSPDELTLNQIMFDLLYYYNGDYKGTNMPEEDYEFIQKEFDLQSEKVYKRFGITEKDIEKMNKECVGEYGYVDPERVSKYCKKHNDMFR